MTDISFHNSNVNITIFPTIASVEATVYDVLYCVSRRPMPQKLFRILFILCL